MKSYYKYWGKAQKQDGGTYKYHLLPYHCLNVAAVGVVLAELDNARVIALQKIAAILQIKIASLIAIVLSIHDLGKFAKTFQVMVPDVQKLLQGENRGRIIPVRHDALGAALWRDRYVNRISERLMDLYGIEGLSILEALDIIVSTTTGHHGIPANPEGSININDFFDDSDFESVDEFWTDLLALFDVQLFTNNINNLQQFGQILEFLKTASWEIAGFITFSDWIGSNSECFKPLEKEIPLNEYWEQSLINANDAVCRCGVISASSRKTYSFPFLFPQISKTPTPLQHFCDTCEIPDIPQLWVLEDVTGAGKTEAALILTARLLSKGLGNGVFIALPTMATSDAMYKRFSKQYRLLFEDNSKPSLVLAHGARHLSKEFSASFLEKNENVEINDVEYTDVHCSRWFSDTNKKALLADAGVGTVDQVLISVLPARHQSLRMFGLHGKVLVIDEVHAYDSYQHRLLCGLLEHHAKQGGSVILLSATLPIKIRQSFTNAYLKGSVGNKTKLLQHDTYPLATYVGSDSKIIEVHQDTRSDLKRSVAVKFEYDYNNALNLLIENAINGKCCCWIRNTVSDAVSAYEEITTLYPKECVSLLHSRFTYADRIDKEGKLLHHFGSKSGSDLRKGRVVVATQVIEQSLDVDFDVIVTDLAPMDYILQRIGRLFRHKRDSLGNRSRKEMRGMPTVIIYGPEPDDTPKSTWYSNILPGASFVYKDHAVLWKTQQAFIDTGMKITTPGDENSIDGIRSLMKKVYGDDSLNTPEKLMQQEGAAQSDSFAKDSMGRFNMLSLTEGYSPKSSSHWYEEISVPTRIGEPQLEVYLAKVIAGKLHPFEKGEYPWDLSVVKVRSGLLAGMSFNSEDSKLIEKLKKETNRLSEKSFVVPMHSDGDRWYCDVVSEKKGPCRFIYETDIGFKVVTL